MFRSLTVWIAIAMAAAGATILAARTETGTQRLASLVDPPTPKPQAEASGTRPDSAPADEAIRAEIRELSQRLDRLAADTARLSERLEAIGRSPNSVDAVSRPAAAESKPLSTGPAREDFGHGQDLMVAAEGFGIDLGPAGSLEELRERWAVIRAQHGGLLEGLLPLATVERAPQDSEPAAMRLVIGPLSNLYAAARLCAVINRTGPSCRATRLEGERMALR